MAERVLFGATSKPVSAGGRSIVMTEAAPGGTATSRRRPGTVLLATDQQYEEYVGLVALDDERVLVAGDGKFIGSPRGIQVRRWPDLHVEASLPAGSAPVVREGRTLLAGAPLWEGRHQACVLLDLDGPATPAAYPLAKPFVLAQGGIIGCIRQRFDGLGSVVDPAIAARWPALDRLVATGRPLLVACSPEGEVRWSIDVETLAPEYASMEALALAPDRATLFFATHCTVGALDPATGGLRFKRRLGDSIGGAFVHLDSIAHDGRGRIAVGAFTGPAVAPLQILDARTGATLHAWTPPDGGRVDRVRFHGELLVAGTSRGQLALADAGGTFRTVRVSRAGINDVLVTRGGVLAACRRRELRFLPLLDDEITPG